MEGPREGADDRGLADFRLNPNCPAFQPRHHRETRPWSNFYPESVSLTTPPWDTGEWGRPWSGPSAFALPPPALAAAGRPLPYVPLTPRPSPARPPSSFADNTPEPTPPQRPSFRPQRPPQPPSQIKPSPAEAQKESGKPPKPASPQKPLVKASPKAPPAKVWEAKGTQTEDASLDGGPLECHCWLEVTKKTRRGNSRCLAMVQTSEPPKAPSFADILAGKAPKPQPPTPPATESASKVIPASYKAKASPPETPKTSGKGGKGGKGVRGVLHLSKAIQDLRLADEAKDEVAKDEATEAPAPKTKSRNTPSGPVGIGELLFAQLAAKSKKEVSPSPVKEQSPRQAEPKASKVTSSKVTPMGNPLVSSEVVYHKGKQRQDAKKTLTTLKKNIHRELAAKEEAAKEEASKEGPSGEERREEGGGSGDEGDEGEAKPSEAAAEEAEEAEEPGWRLLAKACVSKELNEGVLSLMAELRRFQDRLHAKDPGKARLKRRFVCGLREAVKAVGLGRARLLVLAPNLQDHKVLDDKMRGLIRGALDQGTPYAFALNRRALGRAMCKPSPVSALAVLNPQGADELFHRLADLRQQLTPHFQALQHSLFPNLPEHPPSQQPPDEEPSPPRTPS